MSGIDAVEDPAATWYRVAGLFRLLGWASEADRQGHDQAPLLEEIDATEAFLRVRMANPAIQDPRTLWQRSRILLREIARELSLPVPGSLKDQQAIACWCLHIGWGYTLTEIGHLCEDPKPTSELGETALVEPQWADGKATTYERMWIAGEAKASNVTIGALPGLTWLAERWAQAMGVSLPLIPPGPPLARNPHPEPERRPLDGDEATFVRDDTIPDGSILAPGEAFTKTWTIRNTGTVAWTGRYLARVGVGDGISLPKSPPRIPIPDTPPGREVTLSVPMTAHTQPGQARVHFKQTDESGNLYFPGPQYTYGIYCEIIVTEPRRHRWFKPKQH